MDTIDIGLIVKESKSRTEVAKKLGYKYYNGWVSGIINNLIKSNNLNIEHFILNGSIPRLLRIEKICNHCSKKFITIKGSHEREFCSYHCSNSSRTLSEETKHKISVSIKKIRPVTLVNLICSECKSEFVRPSSKKNQRYCSTKCAHSSYKKNENLKLKLSNIMKERVRLGIHKGWKSRCKLVPSYPEKYFMKVLNSKNIVYEYEKPCGKYFIDFAIKDKMIALEVDGKQHEEENRKESDKRKDDFLRQNNWKVFRIKWKNPINDENKRILYKQISDFEKFMQTVENVVV